MNCEVTIKFILPDQQKDVDLALKGQDLALFIWEVKEEFRKKSKYGLDFNTTWGEAYDLFLELYNNSNVQELVEYV